MAGLNLVVSRQAGQNWGAGRVGGSPALGPQFIGAQIEDGTIQGGPLTLARVLGAEQFVKQAVTLVHHQHMFVRPIFDDGVVRYAIRTRVDFPTPEGPTTATHSPGRTSIETSSMTRTAP